MEPWSGRVEDADVRAIEAAADGRLADVLALRERGHDELVTRFQQTSPPITAKGIEDTAFYRHLRLLALNEVGGDPARFGLSVDAFHAANAARAERFPRGLLVTQTHDTKRSGDVRARIGALSTMAEEWAALAEGWVREADAPDEHSAYLVLQTLVGVWPIEPERLEAYVEKALREAKLRTTWAAPDEAYEAAARRYARASRRAPARRASPPSPSASRSRAGARRWASCCSSSPRPACPTSTRATSSRRSASSTPTTAGRSTGARAARRWRGCARGRRRATSASASSTSSAARWPCGRGGPRRSRAPTSRSTPARACAPTCAAARCWPSCRCATGRARGWPCPAAGARCSTTASRSTSPTAWTSRELTGAWPVALLERA